MTRIEEIHEEDDRVSSSPSSSSSPLLVTVQLPITATLSSATFKPSCRCRYSSARLIRIGVAFNPKKAREWAARSLFDTRVLCPLQQTAASASANASVETSSIGSNSTYSSNASSSSSSSSSSSCSSSSLSSDASPAEDDTAALHTRVIFIPLDVSGPDEFEDNLMFYPDPLSSSSHAHSNTVASSAAASDRPHLDCILHKLTDAMVLAQRHRLPDRRSDSAADLLAEAQSTSADALAATEIVQSLIRHSKRLKAPLLDSLSAIRRLLDREFICNLLSQAADANSLTFSVGSRTVRVSVPHTSVVDTRNEPKVHDRGAIHVCVVNEQPVICKPPTACGSLFSHTFYLYPSMRSAKLNLPWDEWLIQRLVPHSGVMYKVYVLGTRVHVVARPSLTNRCIQALCLSSDEAKEDNEHGSDVSGDQWFILNSQLMRLSSSEHRELPDDLQPLGTNKVRSKKLDMRNRSQDTDERKMNETDYEASLQRAREEQKEHAKEASPIPFIIDNIAHRLSSRLSMLLGVTMFGYDLIVPDAAEDDAADVYVVDVNYFPSYHEVDDFGQLLAQHCVTQIDNYAKATR